MKKKGTVIFQLILVLGLVFSALPPIHRDNTLEREFLDPPDAAKPRVWWHWINGQVSKKGITLDLEWMKRAGIGGFQMFDVDVGIRQYVDQRLVFRSPEYFDALRHAAAEAERLGLEMTMHIAGGWSQTGGPWVKPEQAMKKFVWSKTSVKGPSHFTGLLESPPSQNTMYLDVPRREFRFPSSKGTHPSKKESPPQAKREPDPTLYADAAVFAYRVSAAEAKLATLEPSITASGRLSHPERLGDGLLSKAAALSYEAEGTAWVQYDFGESITARAVTIAMGTPEMPPGEVLASNDGNDFRHLATLPGPVHLGIPKYTYAFPETEARFIRVSFTRPRPTNPFQPVPSMPARGRFMISEFQVHAGAMIDRWEDKAGFGLMPGLESISTPHTPAKANISHKDVIDLTDKLDADGRLDWQVPEGIWTVVRMGYSLTGAKNVAASFESQGFEVDKLNAQHVTSYLQGFIDPIAEALGPLFGKRLQYFLLDSWEAGLQNWTDNLLEEFRSRRGYNPRPYLPALTGRVVDSVEVSERFLWDFRRTISDLVIDNYFGLIAKYMQDRGLGIYGEVPGTNRPFMADNLEAKGHMEIPMGEFWTVNIIDDTDRYEMDIREAASAAHIYGKRFVGAEAFTSASFPGVKPELLPPSWTYTPWMLKPLADRHMALGMNRFIIHTSVHQPFENRRPGLTLWIFGQHFNRNETWAEQASAWSKYLARCSHMLQQGLYVADIAYFYGEGAPAGAPYWEKLKPEPPAGYAYDFINTNVLLTRMKVKNGRLQLPDGMSYRVLVLPADLDRMTLPLIEKIRELVEAGAIVIGPKPTRSPSLVGYPAVDAKVQAIAKEVWGQADGKSITENIYGKGRVYWGKTVEEVLNVLSTPADVEYTGPDDDTKLDWIHRRSEETDIYFISNRQEREEQVDVRLRVKGKTPELWYPDSGAIKPVSYRMEGDYTTVSLNLDPHGSVFVIFREPTDQSTYQLPQVVQTKLATVEGPWEVTFPPDQEAPPKIELDKLQSWTNHIDAGVKYFSGTATYSKSIDIPGEWLHAGAQLELDLGVVKEIAEVFVNGKPLGILWKPPFKVDVTGALHKGTNQLEIRITNLWPNRFIGDEQPGASERYAFAGFKPFNKNSPLLESGLLGPVTLFKLDVKQRP